MICFNYISNILLIGLIPYSVGLIPSKTFGNNHAPDPVDMVEPLVDSANSRWFFFNSATRPFGMVNLSPDMIINGAWNSGYRYNEDRIRAISHIHAWQLSGIPVYPLTGQFNGHKGVDAYASRYSHHDETVKAGYHQIRLLDYDINVELTSTTRVGFHRYTFPEAAQSHILFNFDTFLGPCDTQSASVKQINHKEISGYAVMAPTRRRPKPAHVYFHAEFDKPINGMKAWRHGNLIGEVNEIEGERIGVYITFQTKENEQRLMKVGISYVSAEQAKLNLDTELPHWNFEEVIADSRSHWNEMLSRIRVEGGSEVEQRRFYTDLWHGLQGRRIISDVNGRYCDMTGPEKQTGQIPLDLNGKPKFHHYNSDSFWGAQWTINTLWHLVYPEIAEEFVNSMLLMYRDGGLVPRGPSGGNYTYVMTGASSTPFIVSAYMKGLRGFDVDTAYEGLKKNHLPGGIMSRAGYEHDTEIGGGLNYYMDRGYVPYPLTEDEYGYHQDGSGQTLEYAYQDWALAQLAKTLGKTGDYEYFIARAHNYKNIWNDKIGWMWVRNLDGSWMEPLDLLEYHNGWVEGNAAQFTWFVPHDLAGLASLMGGHRAMTEKLNMSFEHAKYHGFVSSKSHDQETTARNRRVYINYGNQPSMQTAMIFNYSGAPWLSQYWSRQVIQDVYSGISPQYGYSGDEDQGLMGSLAVLMKIGLFSMRGGAAEEPIYEITTPIFDKVTINLNPDYYPGDKFVIEAEASPNGFYYITSAKLNGKRWNQPWLYHETLVKGGKLQLQLDNQPDEEWGADYPPPSMSNTKQN